MACRDEAIGFPGKGAEVKYISQKSEGVQDLSSNFSFLYRVGETDEVLLQSVPQSP